MIFKCVQTSALHSFTTFFGNVNGANIYIYNMDVSIYIYVLHFTCYVYDTHMLCKYTSYVNGIHTGYVMILYDML